MISTPQQTASEFSRIAPDSPKSLLKRLQERISTHHDFFSGVLGPEYVQERTEFGRWSASSNWRRRPYAQKAIPYRDYWSLLNVQHLGYILEKESTVGISILQKMLSYVVGPGHDYEVAARKGRTATQGELNTAMKAIEDFLIRYDWRVVQEEALTRFLYCGDVFRWYEPIEGTLDFEYIDSHEVEPPSGAEEMRLAPFGIRYLTAGESPDTGPENPAGIRRLLRHPTAYHIDRNWVPATNVQHAKQGVDSRVERGIPMLWMGYCSAREIDELDYASSQFAITAGSHGVNYEYEDEATTQAMMEIAMGTERAREEAKLEGKQNEAGGVHHAKGHKVVLHQGFNADGFIRLIDSKARRLAAVADVPEFMVLGVADTGSRNTLISAEAPFTRRVQRVADSLVEFDIDLLYAVIASAFGKFDDPAWRRDFRQRVQITVDRKAPDTQERASTSEMLLSHQKAGIASEPTIAGKLGYDYEAEMQRRREHAEAESELRADLASNASMSPEELQQRATTAQILIGTGMTPDEAMERAGLDPIEDRALVDALIDRKLNPPMPPGEGENPEDSEESDQESETDDE